MSNKGVANFANAPHHLSSLWIDGAALSVGALPGPTDKQPSTGANVAIAMDGTATVQLDYRGGDKPETWRHYQWPITVRAGDESDWYKLGTIAVRGTPVYFVDYAYEQELFIAGVELTNFVLPRPTATSIVTGFEDAVYPVLAYLDGVAQTVVSTAPSAGEVQVVGTAVTTPTLTAGQELEIRYVPAYSVVVVDQGDSYNRFNIKDRRYLIIEAKGATS